MNEIDSTSVEIFGREYKIKGVEDEAYIRSVAKYVNDKMQEVSKATSFPTQDRLAVMAALNIADELFQQRQSSSDGYATIALETDRLIRLLDDDLLPKD